MLRRLSYEFSCLVFYYFLKKFCPILVMSLNQLKLSTFLTDGHSSSVFLRQIFLCLIHYFSLCDQYFFYFSMFRMLFLLLFIYSSFCVCPFKISLRSLFHYLNGYSIILLLVFFIFAFLFIFYIFSFLYR